MAQVRYLVDDVTASIDFYTTHLGFSLVQRFGPAMAILRRDDLTLWVAGPLASAARPMPDGRQPVAGGWNRFVIDVTELDSTVSGMRAAGVRFLNDVVEGPGGRQILCVDPSGNPIELFEAAD